MTQAIQAAGQWKRAADELPAFGVPVLAHDRSGEYWLAWRHQTEGWKVNDHKGDSRPLCGVILWAAIFEPEGY